MDSKSPTGTSPSCSLKLQDIELAHKRIERYIHRTPLRRWDYLQRSLGMKAPVYIKLENFQKTGAFKARGAANKILKLKENNKNLSHVIAASAGNHAQAVAWISSLVGIKSTIVMPEGSPLVKAAATKDYGAEVLLSGHLYDEAYAKAQELLKQSPGASYIHAYEDEDIIAGQGTVGCEIQESLVKEGYSQSEPIQVVVPIGGGGLMSGVALAMTSYRPGTKLWGVVCEVAPAMAQSFKSGTLTMPPSKRSRTLAEGLSVKSVSAMTFGIIKNLVDDILVVSDDDIAVAIATLMERAKLVVEGAGAAGVGAALAGKLGALNPDIPTVFVLSGGNIDMNLMSNILERALTRASRWLHLSILVEDKPGELAKVAALLAEMRANVLEVHHDRTSRHSPVGYTQIRFFLETKGPSHVEDLSNTLKQKGYSLEVLT